VSIRNFDFSGTGFDYKESGGYVDIFVTQINSDGSYGWTRVVAGGTNYDCSISSAVDNNDNLYVAGLYSGTADFDPNGIGDVRTSAGGNDIFVTRFSSLNPPVNNVPVANAGVDLTVPEGVSLALDGTASDDSDGNIVSYAWVQTSGQAVTLTGASTATPGFTAPFVDADVTLSFSLTVTDNGGATSTDAMAVTVNQVIVAPTANAGVDQTVAEDLNVSLDGNASTDSDGSITSFGWVQTAGSAVSLTGANTATPNFIASSVSAETTLGFALTITDNDGVSKTDSVSVIVLNCTGSGKKSKSSICTTAQPAAPIANAGTDQSVNEGSSVALDGTGSSDSDGTITSVSWVQTAGPVVALTGTTTLNASFVAPLVAVDTVLTFDLTVTDNDGLAATDSVNIIVLDIPIGGTFPPIANAGADQSVNEGSSVALDGTGSSDSDGAIASVNWVQTAGPAVSLSGATSLSPSFVAPLVNKDALLTFELTVTDNDGLTATDSVNVTSLNCIGRGRISRSCN